MSERPIFLRAPRAWQTILAEQTFPAAGGPAVGVGDPAFSSTFQISPEDFTGESKP